MGSSVSGILDSIYGFSPIISNWNVQQEDEMLQIKFYVPRLLFILGLAGIKSSVLTFH